MFKIDDGLNPPVDQVTLYVTSSFYPTISFIRDFRKLAFVVSLWLGRLASVDAAFIHNYKTQMQVSSKIHLFLQTAIRCSVKKLCLFVD